MLHIEVRDGESLDSKSFTNQEVMEALLEYSKAKGDPFTPYEYSSLLIEEETPVGTVMALVNEHSAWVRLLRSKEVAEHMDGVTQQPPKVDLKVFTMEVKKDYECELSIVPLDYRASVNYSVGPGHCEIYDEDGGFIAAMRPEEEEEDE